MFFTRGGGLPPPPLNLPSLGHKYTRRYQYQRASRLTTQLSTEAVTECTVRYRTFESTFCCSSMIFISSPFACFLTWSIERASICNGKSRMTSVEKNTATQHQEFPFTAHNSVVPTLSLLSSFLAAFLRTWPCSLTMPRIVFSYRCRAIQARTAAWMITVRASLCTA